MLGANIANLAALNIPADPRRGEHVTSLLGGREPQLNADTLAIDDQVHLALVGELGHRLALVPEANVLKIRLNVVTA